MAYGRRKGYRKRPARKGVSRLTKAKPSSITTLAKAVKSIQSKMKREVVTLSYGQKIDNANLSGNVDIFHLSNYSGWNPIFGSSANDAECKKMIHKSMGLDMYFNASSEPNQTNFTVFIVSLKDDNRAFQNSSGNMSLMNDVDYVTLDAFAMINKDIFNIHYVKRFTLGNNGVGLGSSTAQTQYGTDRRFYTKITCNKSIKNSAGDWKQLNASPDPSDNYYLLVFNDNGILDAEFPRCRVNIVHTIQQLA